MLSVSDCTRTCSRLASSAGVLTPVRVTSPSTSIWDSVSPWSGRWRRICLVTAIIDSRSSVAADPARTSVITKLYLGNSSLSWQNAVLHVEYC